MVNVTDYLPVGYKLDGSVDYSTQIQAAIDAQRVGTSSGLYFPPGTYKCNATVYSNTSIIGAGVDLTVFKPASDNPVFETADDEIVDNLLFKDFMIDGTDTKASYTSQDGIYLSSTTTAKYINDIHIYRVFIYNCGRYGIRTYGTGGSTDKFVQTLRVYDSEIRKCANAGVSLYGSAFETSFINTFVTRNGGEAGTNNNCEALWDSGSGSRAHRLRFIGCGFNHLDALEESNDGTCFYGEHVSELYIANCDFESGSPFIHVTGSLSRSHTIIGCNFGSNYDTDDAILVENCWGLFIANNSFNTASGSTTDNGIRFNPPGATGIKQYSVDWSNTFTNYTLPVNTTAWTVEISSGEAWAYRELMIIDTESSAASDDLDSLWGPGAGAAVGTADTHSLAHGQIVTLQQKDNSRDITVKHNTGNLLLKNNSDFAMTSTNCQITLRWNSILGKWLEVSRKYDTSVTYSESNVTADRTFDADSTTLDEVADVLGTLISDLRAQGIVK